MYLKGSTINNRGHARKMAAHLFKDENEIITVRESLLGTSRTAIERELVAMQHYAKLTKGKEAVFSVAISPREHESLSEEQLDRAIEMIEERFKLEGQQKIVIDHVKDGRAHSHVLWSKVDIDNQKLIATNNYKVILKDMAREMEREFEHELTRSRYTDKTLEVTDQDRMRDGRRSPEKLEQRSSVERKRLLGDLWQDAQSPDHFIAMAKDEGYAIARGDKAKFVVIDRDGEISSLARDLPKTVKTKDLESRFQGLEKPLPNTAQVLEQIKGQERTLQPGFKRVTQKPATEIRPVFKGAAKEPEAEIFDRDEYETNYQKELVDKAIEAEKLRMKKEKEKERTERQARLLQRREERKQKERAYRRKRLAASREKWKVGDKSDIKREFAEEVHDQKLPEQKAENDNQIQKEGPNVREGESYITKDFNELTPKEKSQREHEEWLESRRQKKMQRKLRGTQAQTKSKNKDKDQGQERALE